MPGWLRRTARVLAAGTVAGALAVEMASRRWHTATEQLVERLTQGAGKPQKRVSFHGLDGLPGPVRIYFRRVLREGQPAIHSARIIQSGRFRSKETADTTAGWQPFHAMQVFTIDPPGFVWDARIRMAPLVSVRVRDGYAGGSASMLGALLGIVPVVKEADGPELRAGALQRYLAESVWLPTALLPSDRVSWSAVDDSHARATLTDGRTSVSLEFEFGPEGDIVGVYTPGRQRAATGAPGGYVTLPWGGRYRRYEERGGMRAPVESEVYWVVDGLEQPYYRGRNVRVEYDFGEEQP